MYRLLGIYRYKDQENDHKLLWLLLAVFIFCSVDRTAQAREYDSFIWGLGYAEESLKWSSAGDLAGANPNIGRSFEIPSIELATFGFSIKEKNSRGVVGVLEVDYATATAGPASESRYLSDNRSNEYFQRTSEADGGRFLRASLGFGTDFKLLSDDLVLTPLIGYAVNKQRYQLKDAKQLISATPSSEPLGTIDQFNSQYETDWRGYWLGVDFIVNATGQFSVSGSIRYYTMDYDADANWDKQSDFEQPRSFTHIAEGDGTGAKVEFSYKLALRTSFVTGFNFFSWKAEDGTATLYNKDGTQSKSKFNGAEWESNSVYFAVKKYF